ncbi:pilus assembly protein PilM [Conexibacter sp. W3-3-2]|uniref:pilus assembly protein PilM n=1 Tax=Conexibacter sp. W3-3-2 TaxID=2675227 RepID=UPI0018ABE7CC|nr:pilus assembly protein PilM [Conexibacter sp. W3-3-2]
MRVVAATRRADRYTIEAAARAELPVGAIRADVVRQPEAVAQAVAQAFSEVRPKHKRAVVTIPGSACTLQTSEYPSQMTEPMLREAAVISLGRRVPGGHEANALDYLVTGREEDGAIRVIGAAAPHSFLEPLVAAIEGTGINVLQIEPSWAAIPRAIADGRGDTRAAVVDIGASSTTLIAVGNGLPHNVCVLPIGGRDLTEMLTTGGMSLAQAEEIKANRGRLADLVSGGGDGAMALHAKLRELGQQMASWYAEQFSTRVPLLFCGGGSRMPDIDVYLKGVLDVEAGRPTPIAALSTKGLSDFDLHLSAFGACVRGLSDPRNEQRAYSINLLPRPAKRPPLMAPATARVLAASAVVLVASAAAATVTSGTKDDALAEERSAQARLEQAQLERQAAERTLQALLQAGGIDRVALVGGLTAFRIDWRKQLTRIAQATPAEIGLTDSSVTMPPFPGVPGATVTAGGADMQLTGIAVRRDTIERYVKRLATTPGVDGAELVSATRQREDSQAYTFRVSVDLTNPRDLAAATPKITQEPTG